jgi:hypothetical protein
MLTKALRASFAIDRQTSRRFVLDKQGLWPGRRCRGAEGATQLMRAEEIPCPGT